jgi:trk system potassium uptake protein TrkH
MTLMQIVLLVAGDMSLFDSIIHSFGTAGTGGFGIKIDSVSGYSPYCQWVIAIFMMLFGINFNIYYLLLIKKFKSVLKSTELWIYIGIMAISSAVIFANIFEIYGNFSDTIRLSFFQVSSVMTTTGFSTVDFNLWPGLSKSILVFLMIVGACAGSTGGGLKVSRLIILFKTIKRELKKMLHPRSVSALNFEGKRLEENTTISVGVYFTLYSICILSAFLLISFEPFGFESNLTAVIACFNNIGPGLGVVGPMGSYADYSVFSKVILSFAMLFGRLEVFPMLIALTPSSWTKN